jgi:hypothetical protein
MKGTYRLTEAQVLYFLGMRGTEMPTEFDAQDVYDANPYSKIERDLKTSLFMSGFRRGVAEVMDEIGSESTWSKIPRLINDDDWMTGYQAGSTVSRQALELYKARLEGKAL